MTSIGVDLHKKQFTVCYRRSEDDQVFRVYETTEEGVADFVATVTCFDQIAVEQFGFTRGFLKQLKHVPCKVVLVDTTKFILISRSIKKTDHHDAAALAYGLEKGILPKARMRSEAAHQLRSLLAGRQLLIRHRIRIMIQIYSIFSGNGIHVDARKLRSKINRDRYGEDRFEMGENATLKILRNQADMVRGDVAELEEAIHEACVQMKGYDVLASVPGFGVVTIAYLLSTIDDVDDFASPRALSAYLGIVPRTRMSAGVSVPTRRLGRARTGAITRHGHGMTRSALVMSINRLMVHNDSLRAFYENVKGRRGYRKARTAAARKLLTFLYFALKAGKPIEDFSAVKFTTSGFGLPQVECP